MNKKIWIGAIVVAVVIVGIYGFINNQKQPASNNNAPATFNPLNATYSIEGQSITLANGTAEMPAAPGSASKITTTIFGQPVRGDLNGDGAVDAAVILVQDTGGRGTFYYVAAAINQSGTTVGTNAILLGDRIAPQNVLIQNGEIVANYADRKPGEPMSATPSVGVTKYLTYVGAILKTSNPVAGPGERCGGNMTTAPTCVAGYHCAPVPGSHLPFGDVGGTCVSN